MTRSDSASDIALATQSDDVKENNKIDTLFNQERQQVLGDALKRLRSGTHKTLFVRGPEGIGKTTFLAQIKEQLATEKYFIVSGGHFTSFTKLLEALATQLDVAHFAANITANTGAIDMSMEQLVSARLSLICRKMPVLILFDDAHALPTRVLSNLVRMTSSNEDDVCLLMFADIELNPATQEFIAQGRFESLTLRRLARENIADYLRGHYQGRQVFASSELDRIYTLSDGIPAQINQQAEQVLKLRANQLAQAKAAANISNHRTPPPTAIDSSLAKTNTRLGLATNLLSASKQSVFAYSFTLAVVLLGFNTFTENVTDSHVDAVVSSNERATQSPTAIDEKCLNEEDCETELAEVYEEFSHHLSDDELELLSMPPEQYLVQFMAGDSELAMETFVADHRDLGVKMYRSLLDGQPWYKAVVTGFADPESAARILEYLPDELHIEDPFVRTVASVQHEIVVMGEQHLQEEASYSVIVDDIKWHEIKLASR